MKLAIPHGTPPSRAILTQGFAWFYEQAGVPAGKQRAQISSRSG
jgi:hypothetical protein